MVYTTREKLQTTSFRLIEKSFYSCSCLEMAPGPTKEKKHTTILNFGETAGNPKIELGREPRLEPVCPGMKVGLPWLVP